MRLAAWYHDAVYAGLPDDEERSAQRAEQDLSRLGVRPPQLVDEVARLIRLTITHDPAPGDHNGEVLSDADLASLARAEGSVRAQYRGDPRRIRPRPHRAFRRGRVQVLVTLLGGPGCVPHRLRAP